MSRFSPSGFVGPFQVSHPDSLYTLDLRLSPDSLYNVRFETISGLRSHLWPFFFGNVKEKGSESKISSRLLQYTYACVLCTHTRINVCRDLVHPDSSGPASVSSLLLGSHPSTPSVQCVCVRIQPHTPTYTSTRVKIRQDTDNTSICPFVKYNPPRQVTSALIYWLKPPILVPPTLNEQNAHA